MHMHVFSFLRFWIFVSNIYMNHNNLKLMATFHFAYSMAFNNKIFLHIFKIFKMKKNGLK